MWWTLRPRALAWFVGLAVWSGAGAAAADTVTADEALERLQIGPEQRRALLRGDVVAYAVGERGERELANGLALFMPAPVAALNEYLSGSELLTRDATITAHGLIPETAADPATFPPIEHAGKERQEAEQLLEAAPGTRFNLAPREIEAFRALRLASSTARRPLERVSDEYRKVLHDRTRAYQRGGLAAILPYAREGNAVTDPAAELRLGLPDAERVVRYGRVLATTLASYPAAQPAQAVHRFYWIKRRVQRRPDMTLLHQIVIADPEVVLHVERYFYVGHSYNAAQILTGAFAYGDGTVLFATSRFSTDEILGLGNPLKRSIGRSQLRDETRKRLEGVRTWLTRPKPPLLQAP